MKKIVVNNVNIPDIKTNATVPGLVWLMAKNILKAIVALIIGIPKFLISRLLGKTNETANTIQILKDEASDNFIMITLHQPDGSIWSIQNRDGKIRCGIGYTEEVSKENFVKMMADDSDDFMFLLFHPEVFDGKYFEQPQQSGLNAVS